MTAPMSEYKRGYRRGVGDAAEFAGTWDAQITGTKYRFEDIILGKFNLKSKRAMRRKRHPAGAIGVNLDYPVIELDGRKVRVPKCELFRELPPKSGRWAFATDCICVLLVWDADDRKYQLKRLQEELRQFSFIIAACAEKFFRDEARKTVGTRHSLVLNGYAHDWRDWAAT